MSEEVNGFKYIMPDGTNKNITKNESETNSGEINWDPPFKSYHVEEYCEYYNYDGIFSTDMRFDDVFRNSICLYEDINSAMTHDTLKIIAYAYSEFIHCNAENYVAFCVDKDIEGTIICKDDRVFVDLHPEKEYAPGIFVVKRKKEYVLKYFESIEGKKVYGFVCDVKMNHGESRYKKD